MTSFKAGVSLDTSASAASARSIVCTEVVLLAQGADRAGGREQYIQPGTWPFLLQPPQGRPGRGE